jgi:prophage antirepressor-like protein
MFADLGVVSVIAKPFEPMFLAAQVAEALGWDQK